MGTRQLPNENIEGPDRFETWDGLETFMVVTTKLTVWYYTTPPRSSADVRRCSGRTTSTRSVLHSANCQSGAVYQHTVSSRQQALLLSNDITTVWTVVQLVHTFADFHETRNSANPPRPKTVPFLSQQNSVYTVKSYVFQHFSSTLPSKFRSSQVLSSIHVSLSVVSTPHPQALLLTRRTAAATNPIHNYTPSDLKIWAHHSTQPAAHCNTKTEQPARSLHLATLTHCLPPTAITVVYFNLF